MADYKKDLQELDNMRGQVIIDMKKYGHVITEFSCDDCQDRFNCRYVYDPYNTDGDCLALK